MADNDQQQAVVKELMTRIDTLPVDKQRIVMELGSRFNIGPGPAKPKLPWGLQSGNTEQAGATTGSDIEKGERYASQYRQDPGRGYFHNAQGTEELTGALMLPVAKPALMASGGKAALGALGHSVKKFATGAATGAVTGYAVQHGAESLGVPKTVAAIAGTIAGIYGFSASQHVGEFLAETEAPTVGKFLKWMAMRGKPVKIADLPKETQRDIEFKYYEENHGQPPKTAGEKLQAQGEARKYTQSIIRAEQPGTEAPKAPTPFKVKPSIKSRLGTGAPAQEHYSAPSGRPVRQGVNRAVAPPEAENEAETATGVQPTPTAAASAVGTTGPVNPATTRYSEAEGNPSKLTSRELNPGKVINAQANAKNLRMAGRFKRLGMTPDQVQSMTESEYLQHLREENAAAPAGSPRMDPPRPGPNRRSFTELKADIVNAMK